MNIKKISSLVLASAFVFTGVNLHESENTVLAAQTSKIYVNEDFSNGLPENWDIYRSSDDSYTWSVVNGCAYADPVGHREQTVQLLGPRMDFYGYDSAYVTFDYKLPLGEDGNGYASIDDLFVYALADSDYIPLFEHIDYYPEDTCDWTTVTCEIDSELFFCDSVRIVFEAKAWGVDTGVFIDNVVVTAYREGETDGWHQNDQGSWYYVENGSKVTGWNKIGGSWYQFGTDGIMKTGWLQDGGSWYYFNTSGSMVTGWKKIGSSWYYFTGGGAMVTGWKKIGGSWYYFNAGGSMASGWKKIGGSWYYFDGGVMKTGWFKLSGKWYYFDGSGAMVTGTRTIGGRSYNFNSNGVCTNP